VAKKKEEAVPQSITWESVRRELNSTRTDQGQIDYDGVRHRKLAALEAYTKRPAVLYATDFLNQDKTKIAQNAMSITPDDVRGLAEVVRGIPGDVVDLILHSPGGSPFCSVSSGGGSRENLWDFATFVLDEGTSFWEFGKLAEVNRTCP
jgi:ClpP class serine protease